MDDKGISGSLLVDLSAVVVLATHDVRLGQGFPHYLAKNGESGT